MRTGRGFGNLILLTIAFIMILPEMMPANEFVIKSFSRDDRDLAAIRYEIKDLNGDACAVIKIQTDIEGRFLFNANTGIEDVQYRDNNEIWLWVMDGARQLTIALDGFATKKYNFPERIESSKTYNLLLTALENSVTAAIITNPPDAEKWLDGVLLGTGENFEIEFGTHELSVRKNGYRTIDRTIEVTKDQFLFRDLKLETIDVTPVMITSEPSGATIYLNGADQGLTPFSGFLFPGEYEIRLLKSGFSEHRETVQIREGVQNKLNFPLGKNTVQVNLTVSPAIARVLLDDRFMENKTFEISPGPHTLTVTAQGYLPYTEELNAVSGETLTRNIILDHNTGTLSLQVEPKDATVIINRQNYGTQRIITLAPGTYKLEVHHPTCYSATEVITVARNEVTHRSINLERQYGSLQFSVEPMEAGVIMFDSRGSVFKNWYGVNLLQQVPVGNYRLEVTHDGYIKASDSLKIEFGKRTEKTVRLITYEGSRQQMMKIQRRRNLVKYSSLSILAALPIGLEAYSMVNYQYYLDAKGPTTAEYYYDIANNSNRAAVILALTALPYALNTMFPDLRPLPENKMAEAYFFTYSRMPYTVEWNADYPEQTESGSYSYEAEVYRLALGGIQKESGSVKLGLEWMDFGEINSAILSALINIDFDVVSKLDVFSIYIGGGASAGTGMTTNIYVEDDPEEQMKDKTPATLGGELYTGFRANYPFVTLFGEVSAAKTFILDDGYGVPEFDVTTGGLMMRLGLIYRKKTAL